MRSSILLSSNGLKLNVHLSISCNFRCQGDKHQKTNKKGGQRTISEFSFLLIKRNFLLNLLLIWGVSSFFGFPLAIFALGKLGLFLLLLLLHLLFLFLPILSVFTLLLFALLFLLVLRDSCRVSLFPDPWLFKTFCRENQRYVFAQFWSLYWLPALLLATCDQIRAVCSGSDVFFWQIYISCYSNGIRASTMPN